MARAPRAEARPAGRSLADLAESAGSVRSRRTPDPGRRPPWRFRRLARRLLVLLGLAVLLGAAGLGGVAWYLDEQGRPPREWAPYLERRAKGHNPVVLTIADLAARYLRQVDQLEHTVDAVVPPRIGAGVERSGAPVPGMARLVQTTAQLAAALASATPGQVILLVPGTYRIDGRGLVLNRAGTAAAPIVLRAERLGDATLLSSVVEMLKVSAPHWTIENLVARGVCGSHGDCEHAVHVVGAAEGVVIRNNRFEDFNAHIKINGEGGAFPDNGVIAGNTLVDSAPRATGNPVTPIDLVAASNWRISGNFIADFQRDGMGRATYGAFVKGAGSGTVMERNVVLCAWKLRRSEAPNIGLSIGGGGTDRGVMRDDGKSGLEYSRGVIRDNLIAFCNDAGIYVNKGARSVIAQNTVLDTAGISVRFAESSAEVLGNVVDGVVQARDFAVLRLRDNRLSPLLGLFVGQHPVRALFRDVAKLDLRWRERPAAIPLGEVRADLCGVERGGRGLPGAFEDFARCR